MLKKLNQRIARLRCFGLDDSTASRCVPPAHVFGWGYPLKLFQRVITVSLETMKIVRALPKLDIVVGGKT